MQPTANDLSFNLFGFPTSIQPFFWLIAVILSAIFIGDIGGNMPLWIAKLFIGIVAILLSILVHELGHAFSFRYLFNTPCAIVLHGLGGAAIPLQSVRHSYSFHGTVARCFLSFSGPLAGFVLAAVTFALLQSMPPVAEAGGHLAVTLLYFFLTLTTVICIFWGIFNLLPIYPMDGGHIAREFFVFLFPRQGVEFSLVFSIVLSGSLAVITFFLTPFLLMPLFFVYFAYLNYQELTSGRP